MLFTRQDIRALTSEKLTKNLFISLLPILTDHGSSVSYIESSGKHGPHLRRVQYRKYDKDEAIRYFQRTTFPIRESYTAARQRYIKLLKELPSADKEAEAQTKNQ